MNEHASYVIDTLGGPTKLARYFGVSQPAVTKWRRRGIPRDQLKRMSRRAVKPDGYATLDADRLAAAAAPAPQWERSPAHTQGRGAA